MDFALPPDDDPRRLKLRAWLAERPNPDRSTLAAAGLVAPHWAEPWGIGADAEHQLIVEDELHRVGIPPVGITDRGGQIGLGWAGPTILAGGTPEQHRRWLPGILDGTEPWCQLFSEPDAGSDLASLRTRAERDGDHYVVNGQKIWSTWANQARWGILLARTDPEAPKHAGISYFVLDMATPGVEVRKIIEMTGGNHFNETFFTDVHIPADCLIGGENGGWALAKVTLGNERVSLSEGGLLWGMGPDDAAVLDQLRLLGVPEPVQRQRAASVATEAQVLRLLGQRIVTSMVAGRDPGPEASIRKTLSDTHGQHALGLVKDRTGAGGMLGQQDEQAEQEDEFHWGYLFSPALTIGGGTSEVQRTIIGERLLGLPREPKP